MRPKQEGWIQTRIIRNALSNYLTFFWIMGISFLTTPFIVRSLGEVHYGIWVLALTCFGSLTYLELGIGLALTRTVVQDVSKGDLHRLSRKINSVVSMYLVIASVGAITVSALLPIFLNRWFRIGPEVVPLAMDVFYLSAFLFILEFPLRMYLGVLWGFHRFELANQINIVGYTLSQLLIVLFLYFHFGLRTTVLMSGGMAVLQNGAMFCCVRRLLPGHRFKIVFDLKDMGGLVRKGIHVFVGTLGSQLGMQTNRLLLGFFQGVGSLTFYELATKIGNGMFLFLIRASMPLYPAAAQFETQGELGKVKSLFLKATKFVTAASLLLSFLLYISAPFLIRIWMGERFDHVAVTLRILLFGYLGLSIVTIPDTLMYGIGRAEVVSTEIVLRLAAQLLLGFFLVPREGVDGAALVFALSILCVGIPFLVLKAKALGVGIGGLFLEILFPPLILGALASFFFIFVKQASPFLAFSGSLALLVFGLFGFYVGVSDLRLYFTAFKRSFGPGAPHV